MCDIVWVSPQSHSSLSVKPHFLWHALQWPWAVRKRFSSDHWRLWRSKPGSRIVGSTTKVELTTVADCQSYLHQLVTSIDCQQIQCYSLTALYSAQQSGFQLSEISWKKRVKICDMYSYTLKYKGHWLYVHWDSAQKPHMGSVVVRIDALHFLAGCRTRRCRMPDVIPGLVLFYILACFNCNVAPKKLKSLQWRVTSTVHMSHN